jgi:hypothetical protein
MLISEISQKSGFPKDTIRYYEKNGLLTCPEKTSGIIITKNIRRLPNAATSHTVAEAGGVYAPGNSAYGNYLPAWRV